MVNLRKLAAIDIAFLGYRFVLAEYFMGVCFSPALGLLVLFQGHSFWQVWLGIYLICLGMNDVPMLAYTVSIANKEGAQAELAAELANKARAMAKYRRQSLLWFVPFLVLILALAYRRASGSLNYYT